VGPRDTTTYDGRVQLEQDYAPGTIAFTTSQAPHNPLLSSNSPMSTTTSDRITYALDTDILRSPERSPGPLVHPLVHPLVPPDSTDSESEKGCPPSYDHI